MTGKARTTHSEAERLEQLWGGAFGTEYAVRNAEAGVGRGPFWTGLLAAHPVTSVCEIGCNTGANLRWLGELIDPEGVFGVDVNHDALLEARRRFPRVNALWGLARELPLRDEFVDLAFTTGVLIHQPDDTLGQVMDEVVRVSRRFVLCGEYFSEDPVEVQYRGERGALFKRDYGRLYAERYPEMRLLERGFLGRADGWDDVDWWLFEKPTPAQHGAQQ